MEKRFPEGIYYSGPRDGAPAFVVGSISIKSGMFLEWLNTEEPNGKGYVNLDILLSRDTGKPYLVVNDFKPMQKPAVDIEDPF